MVRWGGFGGIGGSLTFLSDVTLARKLLNYY